MTEALRSATVRQTLVLLAVFLVAALASTGFVYLKLAGDLAGGLQADLISEAESFDLSATPPALMAIVGARARATELHAQAGTALDPEGRIVTAGGRVLCACALGADLRAARDRAYGAVSKIRFAGAFCRRDIGHRALGRR